VYGIKDTSRASGTDLLEILFHNIEMQKRVKISDGYIHVTCLSGWERAAINIKGNKVNTVSCYSLKYNIVSAKSGEI
jgi:hypothetical protein